MEDGSAASGLSPEQWKQLHALTRSCERTLGVREGFLVDLLELEVDDRTLVMRAFGLLEASVNSALSVAIGRSEIQPLMDRLTFQTRISFAVAVGVARKSDRPCLAAFAALRNAVVHDVRQIDTFSLNAYLLGLTPGERHHLASTINAVNEPRISDSQNQIGRIACWTTILSLVTSTLQLREQEAERRRNLQFIPGA